MTFLLAALGILITGALLSLLAGRRHHLAFPVTIAATTLTAPLLAAPALYLLTGAEPLFHSTPWLAPAGAFALQIDPLAAAFLLPTAILPPLAAIYASAYLRADGESRNLGAHLALYCILIAALVLVVTAANVLLFMAAWEIMTISSFFLVNYDHQRAEVRQAAWLYLLIAHCGLLMILAFFLVAGRYCNSLNFADFAPLARIATTLSTPLFFLALCGFGIKAGLFPFFVWLPDAHPAAPSHVSAIMSGLLVNTGLYGILRTLTFLPPLSAFWGTVLLALGLLGALYGISMALLQKDIKRSLAYSTVENIGILYMGIGIWIVATAEHLPTAATLAFAGILFHLWNHSLLKGLLFLGAGSLLHAAKTRSLDDMGGLLRRMPQTGLLMIGGSVALSALPPLNAFVSEWLIYLSLLHAEKALTGIQALGIVLSLILFGVVGALAVMAFTRLIGIALLGEPRTPQTDHAHEAGAAMLWPMRILLILSLLLGLAPQLPLSLLAPVIRQFVPAQSPELSALLSQVSQIGRWGGAITLSSLLLGFVLVRLRRQRPSTLRATWGCAFSQPTAKMSYSAESYSEFTHKYLLPKAMRPEIGGLQPRLIFPGAAHLWQHSGEVILQRLYRPLFTAAAERCLRLRWLQQGRLHLYLLYIFACCAVLILWSILDGQTL